MIELTEHQENFIVAYFQLGDPSAAYLQAGYKAKSSAVASACSTRLLKNAKILGRLKELRDAAASAKIMSVRERKERLSEIARGKLTDYMTAGPDGSWVNVGPEVPNAGAIQEIHSRTEYDDNGEKPTVYTSVKLHDPTKAIDLLNKMDGAYAPQKLDLNMITTFAQLHEIAEARRIEAAKDVTPEDANGS